MSHTAQEGICPLSEVIFLSTLTAHGRQLMSQMTVTATHLISNLYQSMLDNCGSRFS